MINLTDIAVRLDAEEKFVVTYNFPIRNSNGSTEYETRTGDLLDVAEDAGLLYVSHRGRVIWIKLDEVVELATA